MPKGTLLFLTLYTFILIVLGQLFVLHVCSSRPLPPHVLPPYAGAGLVHGFVRDLLPPPQLTEHPDQLAHPAHLPSTVNTTAFTPSIQHTMAHEINR